MKSHPHNPENLHPCDLSFKSDGHMIMQCIKIDKPILNYIFW